jgi:hypothetical protein
MVIGVVERADAAREVILSAGRDRLTAHPPIVGGRRSGASRAYRRAGRARVACVGKNMQDHYVARVSDPIVGAQTANERSRGVPLAGEVMRWLFTGKGMLTYNPSIIVSESRNKFNGLQPNSLRIGTGNLFRPSRELNRSIREFICLIRESRVLGRDLTADRKPSVRTTRAR